MDLLEKFHYKLVIVVDKAEKASGTFYIDDGNTFDHINVNFLFISNLKMFRKKITYIQTSHTKKEL